MSQLVAQDTHMTLLLLEEVISLPLKQKPKKNQKKGITEYYIAQPFLAERIIGPRKKEIDDRTMRKKTTNFFHINGFP